MSLLLLLRNSVAAPPPEVFSGGNARVSGGRLARQPLRAGAEVLRGKGRAGGESLDTTSARVASPSLAERSRVGGGRLKRS